jgi:hypothetical protein
MTTTTAAAAQQAGVTVATVRTWCRTGAVEAIKAGGRWVIDTASLAYRIALPALLRPARKAVALTAESLIAIGGRRWQKAGKDRVYLNGWEEFAGIEVDRYGTGNIASATLGGRAIANGRAGKLLTAIDKVWFDAADGLIHITHYDAREVSVRYLDGQRDTVDLVALTRAGITAAVAAL